MSPSLCIPLDISCSGIIYRVHVFCVKYSKYWKQHFSRCTMPSSIGILDKACERISCSGVDLFFVLFVFVSGRTSDAGFIQCDRARVFNSFPQDNLCRARPTRCCSDTEASPFSLKKSTPSRKAGLGKDSSTSCQNRTLPYSRHLHRDLISLSPCLPVCLTTPRVLCRFFFPLSLCYPRNLLLQYYHRLVCPLSY